MRCKVFTTPIWGRFIAILYKFILPAVTIFSLIILGQISTRYQLFGSSLVDFLARVYICVWLCIVYVRLPYLSKKYKPFPGSTTKKSDVTSGEKARFILGAIILGITFAIGTRWVIMEFLPIILPLIYPIAIINGFLFSIPLIAQYEVFKQ